MLICSTQWLTFIDICGSCRPSNVHTTGKKNSSLLKSLESLPVVLEFSRKKGNSVTPGNSRDKNEHEYKPTRNLTKVALAIQDDLVSLVQAVLFNCEYLKPSQILS